MTCAMILAVSAHIGLQGHYNAIHPGISCEAPNEVVTFGAYYNSDRKVSAYLGYRITDHFEVGLVTGYDHPVVPFARLTYGTLFITPAFETSTGSIGVVIGNTWTFK